MARIVVKTAKSPFILEPDSTVKKICMCGLSKTQPFCNGSHLKTSDENDTRLYQYDDSLNRVEVDMQCCDDDNCCGGGDECCGKCKN